MAAVDGSAHLQSRPQAPGLECQHCRCFLGAPDLPPVALGARGSGELLPASIWSLLDCQPPSIPAAASDLNPLGGDLTANRISVGSEQEDGTAWLGGLVGLWLLGVGTLISMQLCRLLALREVRRTASSSVSSEGQGLLDQLALEIGLGRRVRLLYSSRAELPMTWGLYRPVVLMPFRSRRWNRGLVRSIFLHELAHIRRLDLLLAHLTQALASLLWFLPFGWFMVWSLSRESEKACDDVVIRLGPTAREYAGHLVETVRSARRSEFQAAVLSLAGRSQLRERVEHLVSRSHCRMMPAALRLLLVTGVLAFCLLLMMAVPGSGPEESPPVLVSQSDSAEVLQ